MASYLRKADNRSIFIDGTEVTATAAELNNLDGPVAGNAVIVLQPIAPT